MSTRLAPGLLVAVPQLADPNFRHSVVLLLQQNAAGALGVIVNRESPLLLSDLCRDHEIAYSGRRDKRLRSGGPVHPDQGLVLYGDEHSDPDGHEVVRGLHVSASRQTLTRLCDLPSGRFHCYTGYAGWGPRQLEGEISEGSWILAPADPILVLDAPTEHVWKRSLASVGIDPAVLVPGGGGES